ncbi:MAG: FlgD immunoglobulin-like domain containing protein [Candidatus Zixiibacteriota bacterium]
MRKRHGFFLVLFVSLLSTAGPGYAQDLLWANNYGGTYNEGGYSCKVTTNGSYITLGSTYSYGTGDHDIYLLKLDSLGDTLWTRTFGGDDTDYGYDIEQTSDGGFILVGKTRSYGAGLMDVYLIRTDSLGNEIWSKTFGGTANDDGMSVRQTSDGGFIVCGTTNSFGNGYADVYLIKTNALGDMLWARAYGGAGGDLGYAVRPAAAGGYILIGTTGSFGEGYSSMYVVRTNANGDTLWTATYGGTGADLGYAVENTFDGGFVFAGATGSFGLGYYDMYLVKTDPDGWVDWDYTYGGNYDDRAYSVCPTADGGYILAGTTESFGSGMIDIYVVKTDLMGEKLWDNTFGGSKSDYGYMILEESSRAYFLVGYSYSYSAGGSDVYVAKIDGGDPTPVIDDWSETLPADFELHQNYPNPFNAVTQIEFTLSRRSDITLVVYNVLGQRVREWDFGSLPVGTYTETWDGTSDGGAEVASGVYFYMLRAENFTDTRKMILLK